MTQAELSNKHNISQQAISKKTSEAIRDGTNMIRIGEIKYNIIKNGERYNYEEIVDVVVKAIKSDKEYLKQNIQKRREAECKLEAVRAYENRGEMSWNDFVDHSPRRFMPYLKSQRQFLRWVQKVRECPCDESPLVYLVDKRGINAKEKAIDENMALDIERMIKEKPHRKAKRIWEYLQKKHTHTPTYETVRKFVEEWKKKNVFEFEFAKNPDKAKGMFKPAGGSMSQGVSFTNEIWELDATPADVICSDGKRYTISGLIDVYSRRVVMVVEESASYSTLAKVMRKGIKMLGVPQSVKIDNGKDYTSNYFTATCQRLRINQILCPPFSGEYKPHIERFFRTMSMQLFEEMEGYIGHSVKDRADLQAQSAFSAKLESIERWKERYKNGDEFAKNFAMKKENAGLDVGVPLSRDELQMWLDRWIVTYENRRHGGIKCKPIERWNSDFTPVKKIEDERMLDILLGFSKIRTIRKKGIEWLGGTYWSEMFGDMVGMQVWILSDDDMSRIYLYDLDMNYLFEAYNPQFNNISRSSYLAATKKYDKKLAKIVKGLEELRQEAPERMLEKIQDDLTTIGVVVEETPTVKIKEFDDAVGVSIELSNKKEIEADVMINGRPAFSKKFDRFLWDLQHDMVDESTKKLAEKYPDMWDMAENEYKRRIG
ncbi:MAG: DDE-type integrase/transposase/recombinase [Sulfurovaceae bacterium]|nr:DDE-type integrase/transposase/recombinase [Sulfurovaceae bacterium]